MTEHVEAAGLTGLRTMQPNVTVGQHVFFDDIGQVVCGGLALFGQSVKPPCQNLYNQCNCREQQRHHEHELPVQKQQVGNQRCKSEQVARQLHDGVHQQS